MSDLYGLCLLSALGGGVDAIASGAASREALPYFNCMDRRGGHPSVAADCFGDTLAQSSTSWKEVLDCAQNEAQSAAVQAAGRDATPAEHTSVPWVVLNGEVIPDPDPDSNLLARICKAYAGPLPKPCWDL